MSFEFSLAHLTVLQLSPTEMIEVAARTGYQFVSLRLLQVVDEPLVDMVNDRTKLRETQACLQREGIQVHDIELVRLNPETNPAEFKAMLETGAELGARSVMVQIPDGDTSRAINHFGEFCDLAHSFGLTADLEFLPWIETDDLESAANIISGVSRPNAGLLVDTLHFFRSSSTLKQLKQIPSDWINFVQLCDATNPAPQTTEAMIDVARAGRLFPGDGDLDLRPLVEAMPVRPYSLEIPNSQLTQELGVDKFCLQARLAAEKLLNSCSWSSP
jgi:sugar phosphate isomerase/epimerase